MATFSGGQALGSGFRVIARNPLAVLVWCATYLVLALGPWALIAAVLWPQFQALAAMNAAEVSPDSPAATQQMMALMSQVNALQLVQWATSLASTTLIVGAVFRAVLAPHDRAFFYLRVSRQELWLALCLVVATVVMFILAFVCMIPTAMVIAVLAYVEGEGGPSAGTFLAIAGVIFIVLSAMIWLFLRFSLGLPMSFADSSFRLFDSWRLTQSHAGKMALIGVAITAICIVLQAVLMVAFLIVAFVVIRPTAEMDYSALTFQQVAPVVGVGALLITLMGVVGTILYWAPLADIYRQLAPKTDEFGAAGI
jgi:hypothetical protein